MELMANPKFILILRPHCYLIEKERRREGEKERRRDGERNNNNNNNNNNKITSSEKSKKKRGEGFLTGLFLYCFVKFVL